MSETEKPTIDDLDPDNEDKKLALHTTGANTDSDAELQDLLSILDMPDETELDETEYETYQAKASKKRKAEEDNAAIQLMGKFVNLVDLLPPLPKKGAFKVESIKGSQYFFS